MKLKIDDKEINKAIRKGMREAELELNNGFKPKTKVHKSKKVYNRKKYKKIIKK
jgi:hypothetical protein